MAYFERLKQVIDNNKAARYKYLENGNVTIDTEIKSYLDKGTMLIINYEGGNVIVTACIEYHDSDYKIYILINNNKEVGRIYIPIEVNQ